jgi:hypothetical protein
LPVSLCFISQFTLLKTPAMKRLLIIPLFIFLFSQIGAQSLTQYEQIYFTQLLRAQEKYWNFGDIDGYMNYYWGSDSLIFVSTGKLTRGWQKIRDAYEKKYPDTISMGKLQFGDLFFYRLDKKKVITTGSWKLIRQNGNLGGNFTLIWKKIRGRWVIILDYTI